MSKKVRVILLEDVESYGKAGDVVSVTEGYARNFLFSEGKAALATDKVEEEEKAKKEKAREDKEKKLAELQTMAESLEGKELTITTQVKEGNELFGKVSERDIARELNSQTDFKFTHKDIKLDKAIELIGVYDVTVDLGEGVEAEIKVVIEPDMDSLPKSDE